MKPDPSWPVPIRVSIDDELQWLPCPMCHGRQGRSCDRCQGEGWVL